MKKLILIIDDHDYILDSTALLLRFEGYMKRSRHRMVVSVLKWHSSTYRDMILCDISMPVLDGFGVLKELRATHEFSSTPFIFLTARTERQTCVPVWQRADDFLVKPYTRDELMAAVNSQWEKYSKLERRFSQKLKR